MPASTSEFHGVSEAPKYPVRVEKESAVALKQPNRKTYSKVLLKWTHEIGKKDAEQDHTRENEESIFFTATSQPAVRMTGSYPVIRFIMCMLGTKLGSSAKAASTQLLSHLSRPCSCFSIKDLSLRQYPRYI